MDNEGSTSAHIAAANGYDLPSNLLDINVINCTDSFGWTPLMHGAYHGHENVVTKLLSFGADVNIRNDFSASVITLAAASGKVDVVRALIKAGKLKSSESDFVSPLAIASVYGHISVTRYLIDHGFDPNLAMASSGVTPLMLAIFENHLDVAKLLVERGASITCINIAGYSALDLAVLKGHSNIISFLHERIGKCSDFKLDSPLVADEEMSFAAKTGNLLSLRNHLSKNFLFAGTSNYEGTAVLANHCDSDDWQCVSKLSGVPKGPKETGRSFTHNLCTESFNTKYLQDNKIANSSNKFNEMSGCREADFDSEFKYDVATENDSVNSALMAACVSGHIGAVYLLIAAGANPNYEQEGRTPLMVAATGSHVELTKLLLSVGAEPLVSSSKDHLTAFDLATLFGAPTELTRLLGACTLQSSFPDSNEVPQLVEFIESDCLSSPFSKIKKFKFALSPKESSSSVTSSKFFQNQLVEKDSSKMLSPYRCKLLGSSNSKESPKFWVRNKKYEKRNPITKNDHRIRFERPIQTQKDTSQLYLSFPDDTPFRPLPSDYASALRIPQFIPVSTSNQIMKKTVFGEEKVIQNESTGIKITDVPVKILNLI